MRFALRREGGDRRWPRYLFGGRMRTSTFALIAAFFLTWWLYETYSPAAQPSAPETQVVPPGFVPDPEYTWVPRTSLQTRPPETTTPTTTTTTTTEPTETTPTESPTETIETSPDNPVTTPTPLPPGVTPQTTAENRSGTPTITPTTTVPPGPGPLPIPLPGVQ